MIPHTYDARCIKPVEHLYSNHGNQGIRLTRCKACGEVADKYVEYELLLVMMDVLLHRRAAFIHIVNNRWSERIFEVNFYDIAKIRSCCKWCDDNDCIRGE